MNFTTPIFFYFFLFVFILRWMPIFTNKKFHQKYILLLLLISSYIFYMSWDYRFGSLLLLITVSDFLLGYKIYVTGKKRYLIFSIVIDLGILAFFKYSNFFAVNLELLFPSVAFIRNGFFKEILLPLGISFYVFQSLAYTIDVYRQEIVPERNIFHYALFLSFFPQLVAGPVVSSRILLPQFKFFKKFSDIKFNTALYYLLSGFIKKSVLADHISIYVDPIFSSPEAFSWDRLFIGIISYSIQIYCDFSGYSDIAIGLGHLLGFELPENFNMPYIASSLTDFWRRWHITLSGWLKSYLYFSLGGNRISSLITYRNLFITMLLGGLWHGASWNFIIWGGLHGIFLGMEKFVGVNGINQLPLLMKKTFRISYVIVTFFCVTFLWVFFRAENLPTALNILTRIITLRGGRGMGSMFIFDMVVLIILISHILGIVLKEKIKQWHSKETGMVEILTASVLIIVAVFLSGDTKPFIYFVF